MNVSDPVDARGGDDENRGTRCGPVAGVEMTPHGKEEGAGREERHPEGDRYENRRHRQASREEERGPQARGRGAGRTHP